MIFKNGKAIDRLKKVEWEDLDNANFVSSPVGSRFKALSAANGILRLKPGSSINMDLSNGFTWSVWAYNRGNPTTKGVVIGNLGSPIIYFEPESSSTNRLAIYGLTNTLTFIPITFGRNKWN